MKKCGYGVREDLVGDGVVEDLSNQNILYQFSIKKSSDDSQLLGFGGFKHLRNVICFWGGHVCATNLRRQLSDVGFGD